jgi:hypothetical protein
MHPVSNVDFGNEAGKIKIRFHNGTSIGYGYIVKQLSIYKFIVSSDGVTQYVCKLAKAGNPVAGELVIDIFPVVNGVESGTAQHVKKLLSKRATTIEGGSYAWTLGATTEAGHARIASI